MQPYYQDSHITIYLADMMEAIPTLNVTFDACITDPPYMIGAASVGNSQSKSGGWHDLMNASYWYKEWMKITSASLYPMSYLLSFTNWRSLPVLMRALSDTDLKLQSCAVWDKEWIGPASKGMLRPTYEMILFCSKGEGMIINRGKSDIFRYKWMASHSGDHSHPAEKPIPLLEELITLITQPGNCIIDPFMGGGTTLVAAKKLEIKGIGIEINESYAEQAAHRLSTTTVGQDLGCFQWFICDSTGSRKETQILYPEEPDLFR